MFEAPRIWPAGSRDGQLAGVDRSCHGWGACARAVNRQEEPNEMAAAGSARTETEGASVEKKVAALVVEPTGVEKHRFDVGLEDLQTFLAVAELGSFSRAAKHLNLSQPSVSNRVRRLEEKLLVRLLERTTRRVELTQQGGRLYVQSSEALRGLRGLLQEFNSEASSRGRQVKVAATFMIATAGLPPVLRLFHDANPAITVLLHDLSPAEAAEQVADGRCDLGVMAQIEPRPGLSFEPLVSDPCVVVTPLGHPLLRHAAAPFAEVIEYPLLSPAWNVGMRGAIAAEADKRGLTLRLSPEAQGVSNALTLIAMATAGFGVCIHPRSFIPSELRPTIGVVPLADCEIVRTFGIVTAVGRALSRPARLFCASLRSFNAGARVDPA